MARTRIWATSHTESVGEHQIVHFNVDATEFRARVSWAASTVPRQYSSSEEISDVLAALGKPTAARFLEGKLPTTTRIRSGELGEILGSHYAARELGYRMVARLRWKDSRDMAMRGDDLLGVRDDGSKALKYLKGEAKSRASLSTSTLTEAGEALLSHRGRPSPHALSFVASRLREMGETTLGMRIHDDNLNSQIPVRNITQLLFTFSGNNPRGLLRNHTLTYEGKIRRMAVGLQIAEHQKFIKDVFEKVIHDARTR